MVSLSALGMVQKKLILKHVSVFSVPGKFKIRNSHGYGLSFSRLEIIKTEVVKPDVVSLFLSASGTLKTQDLGFMGSESLLPRGISNHGYGRHMCFPSLSLSEMIKDLQLWMMWFLLFCLRDYQNIRCTVLWVLCRVCLGKDSKMIPLR